MILYEVIWFNSFIKADSNYFSFWQKLELIVQFFNDNFNIAYEGYKNRISS